MIPTDKRLAVYYFLAAMVKNGKLPNGALTMAANKFEIHEKSVRRIWKKASESLSNPETRHLEVPDVTHNMRKAGRKKVHSRAEIIEKLKLVPCKHRSTLREAANAVGMSCTHFHRILKKENIIVPCSTTPKPLLTDTHRENRVNFVRERISPTDPTVFHSQFNVIHLDEKWFNERALKLRYYRCRCEQPITSHVRHKSHIPKVMFISAVCRPRRYRRSTMFDPVDANGALRLIAADDVWPGKELYFDGKIGLYPLINYSVAKRNSKLRQKVH